MTERPAAQSFEDPIVWQKAHAQVLNIYKYSRSYCREETCGLTSQLRRSAVSVPANTAKGFKKRGPAIRPALSTWPKPLSKNHSFFFLLTSFS